VPSILKAKPKKHIQWERNRWRWSLQKLLQYFLKVDRMNDEAKKVIMSVIDGMVAKEKEKK
jgi:hypothetical protein